MWRSSSHTIRRTHTHICMHFQDKSAREREKATETVIEFEQKLERICILIWEQTYWWPKCALLHTHTHTSQPYTHKRVLFGEHRFHTRSILLSPYRRYCMKNSNRNIKTNSSNAHILPAFASHKKCKICEHPKPGKLLKKTAPTIILHLRFHSMQRQHHTNKGFVVFSSRALS